MATSRTRQELRGRPVITSPNVGGIVMMPIMSAIMQAIMGDNAEQPSFQLPLLGSIVPTIAAGSSTPTFTRATAAATTDFEGLIKACVSGESRFYGLRRVYNPISANVSSWASTSNVTVTSGISDPNGGTSAYRITATAINGYKAQVLSAFTQSGQVVNSCWVRRANGSGAVNMYNGTTPSGTTAITSVIDSTWKRITTGVQTFISTAAGGSGYIGFSLAANNDAIDVWQGQSELVHGQSNQNPSEYVSVGVLSAPFHGANVDGVKYFATTNGNTVASNVVTEATGSAIATATMLGYMAEGSRTNRCLDNRFTNGVHASPAFQLITGLWLSPFITGAAELVTNGGFATDVTGWTGVNGGTIVWNATGKADVTTSALYGAYQAITCVVGKSYVITATQSGAQPARIILSTSSSSYNTNQAVSTSNWTGTKSFLFTATGTTMYIHLGSHNGTVTVTYDDISVKEVQMHLAPNSTTAPDGTTTAATLTATEANSVLTQDMGTVASAAKAWGVWMKRKTGTGNVELTMDNGATWTTVTVTSSWTLVQMSQTLADEDVGIRLATQNDEVYVWNAQLETAAFISMPIGAVQMANVTRNADLLTYPFANNASATVGTLYVETRIFWNLTTPVTAVVLGFDTTGGPVGPSAGQAVTTMTTWDGTSNITKAGLSSIYANTAKIAVSYTGSTRLITGEGLAAQSGSFDGSFGSTAIAIGSGSGGANQLYGTIRNVTIYPTADNAAALQARTA